MDKAFHDYAAPILDLGYLAKEFGIMQREFEIIGAIFQIYEKTGLETRVELVQGLSL